MAGAAGEVQRAERTVKGKKSTQEEGSDTAAGQAQADPAGETAQPLSERRLKFRERFAGYIREKLLKSIILGVRWMAPFVAGGGILIALAFLFDAASVDLASLSVSERANFGSITPQAAALKNLGGTTFNYMLPVFAGFMAYGLAGEEAFMTGFVGGYMTIGANAGFIGAMIAGFVAGIITNEMRQFTGRLPRVVRKAAPIIIFPVFNLLLMQLISVAVITPLSNAVGSVFKTLLDFFVQSSPVSAGALSGMMMAVDMGGIVNKVAYNYGVNGLLAGRTDIMACVMIGGMVPPMGIALSMLLFRDKYAKEEQDLGLGAFFMGLSFITEGALPFVFTDFVRVIPSCMLGSALAGLLSMLFGCTLPAPHGGVFVFPVMGHPVLYLIALFAGTLVTAVTLGRWKKPVGSA
jgi:fructose-specific phosphotransferase system IIC component